jgi:branched-subunit amino acid transport protein
MSAWVSLLAASVLSFALRAGPSLLRDGVTMPQALQRANRFAAPALMGALASRGITARVAAAGVAPVVPAVVAAAVIGLRTRSMIATIAAGMAVHLLAVALLG